jgi:hypothetical protein
MKPTTLLGLLFALIFFQFCSSNSDNRKDFTGHYNVKLQLDEGTIPKAAIKDSIKAGFAEAKEALKNAKIKINEDIDLSKVDTTTAEGKIEYAAKAFGKGMGEFGIAMGEFGKSIGELAAGVASGSLDFADAIINKIAFDLDLNDDGSIKAKNTKISNFSFEDANWEVEGKTFYLIDKDKNKEAFEIISKKEDGFILKKDKVKFIFSKRE